MTTEVLGPYEFSETPTVAGAAVLTSATIPATGVVPGTYGTVEVQADGRVTGGLQATNSMVAYYTGYNLAATGTTVIPTDTTIPLISEGTQLWSQTVVPNSLSSKFVFDQVSMCDSSTNNRNVSFALFRGSACIYATTMNIATAGRSVQLSAHAVDSPNTLSSITYSMRVGINVSTNWWLNQSRNGAITFGSLANKSDWSILEIV